MSTEEQKVEEPEKQEKEQSSDDENEHEHEHIDPSKKGNRGEKKFKKAMGKKIMQEIKKCKVWNKYSLNKQMIY